LVDWLVVCIVLLVLLSLGDMSTWMARAMYLYLVLQGLPSGLWQYIPFEQPDTDASFETPSDISALMTKLTNKNISRAYVLVGFGDRPTAVSFSRFYRINLEQSVIIPCDSTSVPSDALRMALCLSSTVVVGAGIESCMTLYR
jgi:hypothetical protein